MNNQRLDKQGVARSFAKAAPHYDDVAVLQRQTADELLERLSLMTIEPERVLDLGSGTGRNLALLGQHYPSAQLLAVDIAPAMLNQARQYYQKANRLKRWLPGHRQPCYVTGDAEKLPLADDSVDLIFANLLIQWCDLQTSLREISRILKPEGLLMFTTLGPDTLTELRQSWAAVDDYPHVNVFFDMHDVGDAMMAAALTDPVLDVEYYTLTYTTAMELMKDLKQLGARNLNSGRRRGLTGRQQLQQVSAYYEQFRHQNGLPATYEVIFAHAWGSTLKQQQDRRDEVYIAASEISRRHRK